MANLQHRLQFTTSSSSGVTSVSGADVEGSNTNAELFGNFTFSANSVNTAFTLALNAALLQDVTLLANQPCTIRTNGLNAAEVQTLTITGTPTGGSFPLSFGNSCISSPYNTNASSLQTLIQGMASIGAGNLNCSGGPLPGTAITMTFAGALNSGQQPIMATSAASLTGGTNTTCAVARTNAGLPTSTITLAANIPLVWGTSMGYGTNPFSGVVNGAFLSCNTSTQLKYLIGSL